MYIYIYKVNQNSSMMIFFWGQTQHVHMYHDISVLFSNRNYSMPLPPEYKKKDFKSTFSHVNNSVEQ